VARLAVGMAVPIRALLVADAAGADRGAVWLADELRSGNWAAECTRANDEPGVRAALAQGRWDAVICIFEGGQAPAGLRALRDRRSGVDPALIIVADAFDDAAEAAQRLGATVCLRARGFAHLGPAVARALGERDQLAAREDAVAFDSAQVTLLEHMAAGRPLADVLEEIVLLVERQGDGMLCSILLLDGEAGRIRHGAAPHLPGPLIEGIEGALIGPHEGSCGAAAWSGEVVVIEDIGTHPNWTRYRQLALPFGLRACWSSPIKASPHGEVLGTFAMYYRDTRPPTARERSWVARATHLASISIWRDRAERAAREAGARYRQIVDTTFEGVCLLDEDARVMFANQRAATMLGYPPEGVIGRSLLDFMDEPSRRRAQGAFIERLRTTDQQFEVDFRREDGTVLPTIVTGSPVRDDKNRVVGALAMLTDITTIKKTQVALRRSEKEMRAVFEHAAIGMALVDEQGRMVKSNAALQQFLGRDERELAATNFFDLSHPDDLQRDREVADGFRTGTRTSYQAEKRFVRKDGAVLWGRLAVSTVKSRHDDIPGAVIVTVENVTQRREMEEAVRSTERLRALMYGAVSDVLFYMSVEPEHGYRFLSINPAFTRATGLAESQVVGQPVERVIPEPSLSMVRANFARAIEERRTVTWDEVTPYPAGLRYGEVSLTPIFDGSGTCTNLVGTVHDVTERRLAEQRLAAQAALLDKAQDAILVRGLDGTVRYWNKGAEKLYGWTAAEAVNRDVRDLIYRDRSAFDEAQRQMLETGQCSGEVAQVSKTGRPLVVECSWTLIADEGAAPEVLVINTDITARKSLEAQVLHAQRLESLGTLAGGVAHDFNNLLTVMSAGVQYALAELKGNDDVRAVLMQADQAASQGAALVRQLLTFSRRDELKRLPVKLQPLVVEALGLLRVTLPAGVRLETSFDPEVPEVLADATQVHQVVMNLGTNAAHAMAPGGGLLDVRLERAVLERPLDAHDRSLPAGTYARLTVRDTGAGMDAATLGRVFDPFFTTKKAGEGTGLGLSVVQGIMRNHGGGIVLHSAPGRGTVFELYFPATPRR
jgi:PAS domain S-box-containing protein